MSTRITVDASNTDMGSQVQRRKDQFLVLLAFFLRKSSDSESKYSGFDRELMASYRTFQIFGYFLDG